MEIVLAVDPDFFQEQDLDDSLISCLDYIKLFLFCLRKLLGSNNLDYL
jgi:hypothetical protein